MVSIVLLQNDPLVGEGLRKALSTEPGLHVIGLATSLSQARQCLERARVDLLVADLRIGNERLAELLRKRHDGGLQGRTLVLAITMSPEDPQLMQALRQGADGYFVHGSTMKALAGVIRQVLAGESPMSPQIARRLQAHFKCDDWTLSGVHRKTLPMPQVPQLAQTPSLTDAERQMLNRVSQGYLLHEIAREMQTSEHSVGLKTRSLYRKLQLDVRGGALLSQAA